MNITQIITIIEIVALIVLILSHRLFTNSRESLPGKAKAFIVGTVIVVFLPTTVLLAMFNYSAFVTNKSDYWLKKAQSTTDYHIYHADRPPTGRVLSSQYTRASLGGLPGSTRIVYSMPLSAQIKGTKASSIIVNQVGVPADFDLDSFTLSQNHEAEKKSVQLPIAKNETGLLYGSESTSSAFAPTFLYFVTRDNVLVNIATAQAGANTLILLANSLK